MCHITSASIDPCDCPDNCYFCGEVMDDETSYYIESRKEVICEDCYERGVSCDGCDTMLTWDDYEAQVEAKGEAWCAECAALGEEE